MLSEHYDCLEPETADDHLDKNPIMVVSSKEEEKVVITCHSLGNHGHKSIFPDFPHRCLPNGYYGSEGEKEARRKKFRSVSRYVKFLLFN